MNTCKECRKTTKGRWICDKCAKGRKPLEVIALATGHILEDMGFSGTFVEVKRGTGIGKGLLKEQNA